MTLIHSQGNAPLVYTLYSAFNYFGFMNVSFPLNCSVGFLQDRGSVPSGPPPRLSFCCTYFASLGHICLPWIILSDLPFGHIHRPPSHPTPNLNSARVSEYCVVPSPICAHQWHPNLSCRLGGLVRAINKNSLYVRDPPSSWENNHYLRSWVSRINRSKHLGPNI